MKSYQTALLTGDVDAALEYHNYHVRPEWNRSFAKGQLRAHLVPTDPVDESGLTVSCKCTRLIKESHYDVFDSGYTGTVTDAQLVVWNFTVEGRDIGGDGPYSDMAFKTDGDGWYVGTPPRRAMQSLSCADT